MSLIEQIGLRALRRLDPEAAHGMALKALNAGFGPKTGPVTSPRLRTTLAGLNLPNPIGLAAGFDKNAEALGPLSRAGFGFLEVGAATPRPQSGNPKPRLFRLTEDRAAINRFGFNNDGMGPICGRLAAGPKDAVIGLNLGANKDSADRAADFATVLQHCAHHIAFATVNVLQHCAHHIAFATVNVSSPNTEKLRDLQGKAALAALLDGVMQARGDTSCPVFLKIAPDLGDAELSQIAEVAKGAQIDAIIATNTTLSRDGLHSPHRDEKGGLSGVPLFEKSTRVLARLATLTDLPLIGVGGVSSAEEAYTKIKAGASAVQLYTAMVYHGISLAGDIARGLETLLARDGFDTVADAIGTEKERWT